MGKGSKEAELPSCRDLRSDATLYNGESVFMGVARDFG